MKKSEADLRFLVNMMSWCRAHSDDIASCRGYAALYYTAVDLFGTEAYNEAQRRCDCNQRK